MKNRGKKTGLAFIIAFLSITGFAQNPFKENTLWKTSERIDHAFEEITLSPIDSADLFSMKAYYRVQFGPDSQFVAYNIPGCGLDCVVHATGYYSATSKTIQFTLNRITKQKGCTGDSTLNQNIGTYYWINDESRLRLVRTLNK